MHVMCLRVNGPGGMPAAPPLWFFPSSPVLTERWDGRNLAFAYMADHFRTTGAVCTKSK
jgi:hypothetical protein